MREQEPVVSIASSQRAWAAELLRFLSDYGGARLQGTVLTGADALEQDYEVLIIDDIASFLSPRLIERVRRSRRKIVGVYDPEVGDGRPRLMEMGVDAAIESDAGPDEFLEIVASLSAGGRSVITDVSVATAAETPNRQISVVVGNDLASDLALALAGSFSSGRRSTVLVDADTLEPSIAQRLSMPLVPNLLTALDALVQLRGDISDSLSTGPEGMALLTGLPQSGEWETIKAGDTVDLVEQLSTQFDEVVVKLSPSIEDLSQFGGKAGRHEVARSLTRIAGDITYLAEPTPLGLARCLAWVAQVRQLTTARIHVAFGDAPSSLYQRGELAEELTRSFVPASIVWLPVDPKRVRSAWNGESIPSGPFKKAVFGHGEALMNGARSGSA